jgi:molybdopterin-guanine dinucleotide biosynthesis protein A
LKSWIDKDLGTPAANNSGSMYHSASAVILGGGRGKRMGGNKLFLAVDEIFLVHKVITRLSEWFRQVLIVVSQEDRDPFIKTQGKLLETPDLTVIVDKQPGLGPLEGLATALEQINTEWAFVAGCDMPSINEAVLRAMWGHKTETSSIICASLEGFIEPLHAFYRKDCIYSIRSNLEQGKRKLKSFYRDENVTRVDEISLKHLPGYRTSFASINTPEELRSWLDPGMPHS